MPPDGRDLLEGAEGMALLLHPPQAAGKAAWGGHGAAAGAPVRGGHAPAMAPRYDGQDPARFDRLADLAAGWACPRWPRPSR